MSSKIFSKGETNSSQKLDKIGNNKFSQKLRTWNYQINFAQLIVCLFCYLVKLESNINSNVNNNIKIFGYNQSKKENSLTTISKTSRYDSKGSPILKGQKKHTVSFCDLLGKNSFEEVIEVEPFKKFNIDVSTYSEEPGCSCKCILI